MMPFTASLHDLPGGFRGSALSQRLRAAAIHFGLSVSFSLALLFAALSSWYPQAFFHASGGASLLLLIVVIDVIMGPALTFVVFDRRKKSLRWDLTVVAVLQAVALAYGLYALCMGRPVLQTFVVDRFELVSAAEIDPAEQALAPRQFRATSWSGPVLAAALLPADQHERESLVFSAAAGVDLRHMLRYYVDYDQVRHTVLAASPPLSALADFNDPHRVSEQLDQLPATADQQSVRWLPVSGRREDLVALIDATTARVLAVVRLKPWKV